jgi:polysaccharide pyruvyl transferase WcaK-like protein
MLPIKKHTVFITLRRFKPSQRNHYTEIVGETLAHHPKQSIIVSLMEPKEVDPEGYALIKSWQKKYPNITIADFSYNPLALYLFFQKHHDSLTLIGPQFHVIITAELTGVPFLPIVYDNKVAELLKQNGTAHTIGIKDLTQSDINTFIERSRA